MSLVNQNTGKVLVERLHRADTFWGRFLGLLPYKELPESEGMLLTPCRSVHTFFMRFPIDVIYLDSSYRVVALFPEVKPWRALPTREDGWQVLETAAGIIAATGTDTGHRLRLNP